MVPGPCVYASTARSLHSLGLRVVIKNLRPFSSRFFSQTGSILPTTLRPWLQNRFGPNRDYGGDFSQETIHRNAHKSVKVIDGLKRSDIDYFIHMKIDIQHII